MKFTRKFSKGDALFLTASAVQTVSISTVAVIHAIDKASTGWEYFGASVLSAVFIGGVIEVAFLARSADWGKAFEHFSDDITDDAEYRMGDDWDDLDEDMTLDPCAGVEAVPAMGVKYVVCDDIADAARKRAANSMSTLKGDHTIFKAAVPTAAPTGVDGAGSETEMDEDMAACDTSPKKTTTPKEDCQSEWPSSEPGDCQGAIDPTGE